LQIGEGMSVPLLATWPAMEEREKRGIYEEECGKLEKVGIWEKVKACGGRKEKEKKEKGKEFINEDIFSNLKMKISETQISGFKSRIRKTFRKIPKSSEIQVSRNDS